MNNELEQVKLLREKTGAGMLNCKKALLETNGNFADALIYLRQKGLMSAEKKQSRATTQGVVASYIHTGSKVGVLIELNCETDFVARRIEFQKLARDLAMQVTANESVQYVSIDEIPQKVLDLEINVESEREDLKEKPTSLRQSIIKERVEKNLKNLTLLNQMYLRDPNLSVEDLIKTHVSLLGENIKINRFTKFIVGQN
jgi:elongation factor Ts